MNRAKAVSRAVFTYFWAGGITDDASARHTAARALASDLGVDDNAAFELLADALAQRAARNLTQAE